MEITTIGLDLAKNVFQVHAISSTGEVVVRRALRRAQVLPFFSKLPPCLVGVLDWSRDREAVLREAPESGPAKVTFGVVADANPVCPASSADRCSARSNRLTSTHESAGSRRSNL